MPNEINSFGKTVCTQYNLTVIVHNIREQTPRGVGIGNKT